MAVKQMGGITLMVLTKGFRVSQDSEEFQLVWPPSPKALTYETERRLLVHDAWPAVLRALYSMPPLDTRALQCVLLTPSAATSVAVSPSRDRYDRPMFVAVCATAPISWDSAGVDATVAQLVALSRDAAGQLSSRFERNPKEVALDLRNDRFQVDLSGFSGPSHTDLDYWRAVILSARQWNGISGLGAPPLIALGANVLLGTEHEAMRFAGTGSGATIDGFYDPVAARIVPISRNLAKWHQPWQPKADDPPVPVTVPAPLPPSQSEPTSVDPPPPVSAPPETYSRLESIDDSLKSIDRSLGLIAKLTAVFVDNAIEFWLGKRSKRDRK